uniref:Uncharacterized protein n=1 Tax=Rhizophagus irregularis (strain DAOM 181602 / DAOM 197198 / MUCL 43194) TaxID=747089 RepID=U9UIM2_RHIID
MILNICIIAWLLDRDIRNNQTTIDIDNGEIIQEIDYTVFVEINPESPLLDFKQNPQVQEGGLFELKNDSDTLLLFVM